MFANRWRFVVSLHLLSCSTGDTLAFTVPPILVRPTIILVYGAYIQTQLANSLFNSKRRCSVFLFLVAIFFLWR